MSTDFGFPKRVTRGDDGAYSWTYDLKAHHNSAPFQSMLKIAALVFVPIAAIMLPLTWPYGHLASVISCLGLLVAGIGLPALIGWLAPLNPSFYMSEDMIRAWPQGRGANIHSFKGVRVVEMRPDIDCVRLHWLVTGLNIYIPPEDYEWAREYIIAHVPESAEKRW